MNIHKLFYVFLLFCPISLVWGQRLSYGVALQGNYSRIRNIENVRRVAYGTSVFVETSFKDHWRLRPYFSYNQVGGLIDDEFLKQQRHLRLHYFENQNILYYLFEGQYWHYQFSAGLSWGYLWKAKYGNAPSFDLREFAHDYDYGWLVGFGFRYEMGGWQWLSVDVQHYWGRSSVFDVFDFPVRNSVFSLRLAYSLPIRIK